MTTPNNLPVFTNGLTSASDWINQYISLFSYLTAYPQVELIFTTPATIVPGKIYLIGTPQTGTSPGTSGDVVVYLTTSPLSAVPLIGLANGTVIGSYTKLGTNWVRSTIADGGLLVATAAGTITLPATFDGVCTIVTTVPGVIIAPGTGRTGVGLINTSLAVGVYQVFQNLSVAVI
jgi:hypothetical protein